jgi:flagellar biosynthesis/type III secretory pathway chaperone
LGRLISDETRALHELALLLEREHACLDANDVPSLEAASHERQKCVARIMRFDEERRTLCRVTGYPLDATGLEQLLRWCDPQRTLSTQWTECSDAASKCRRLNDRNGALVAARLLHVQARLGTLIAGARAPVTYGPRGAYKQASSGRVLAVEA